MNPVRQALAFVYPVVATAFAFLPLVACGPANAGSNAGGRDPSNDAAIAPPTADAGTESSIPDASAGTFRVPADTAPHARTWMAWPDSTNIWGPQLSNVQAAIARIAKTIAKYEPIVMLANPTSAATAQSMCGPTVKVMMSIPVDDCWIRDSGPIFRTNGAGIRDVTGTNFNGWGDKQPHANDALVAQRVASYLGLPFTAAAFIGEGGAIESDGAGTVMATESSLVNANRNPATSRARVEAAVLAAYGASKMIWFPGVTGGKDITDDHVDATSRFVDSRHALVQVPAASDRSVWANDQRQQFQTLSASPGAGGARFSVTKLMSPDWSAIRGQSSSFVASYANYYVCNGAVIAAQFGDASADAAAKTALAAAFPGRVIEQLDVDALGAGGGGIHCVTQQEPAK